MAPTVLLILALLKTAPLAATLHRVSMPIGSAGWISTPSFSHLSPEHRVLVNAALLGNRLTVDPRTLTPLVLVRIQVPQPFSHA